MDIIGKAGGNAIDNPETQLADFDIVFAVGHSALEAMSVGCAVIVANPLGAYGMNQPQNLESMFGRFGITSLVQERMDPAFLHSEIRKYDVENTLNVALCAREKVGLQAAAEHYEAVYRAAISDWDENPPGLDAIAE